MPTAMKRLCTTPGCNQFAQDGSKCETHKVDKVERAFRKDPERHKLYDRRWRRRRETFLAEYPWCEDCMGEELYEPATEVHHVVAHRGNVDTFFSSPMVGLCKSCHSRRTGRGE
jgi:5-methylcytosine-specific restriction protein A